MTNKDDNLNNLLDLYASEGLDSALEFGNWNTIDDQFLLYLFDQENVVRARLRSYILKLMKERLGNDE